MKPWRMTGWSEQNRYNVTWTVLNLNKAYLHICFSPFCWMMEWQGALLETFLQHHTALLGSRHAIKVIWSTSPSIGTKGISCAHPYCARSRTLPLTLNMEGCPNEESNNRCHQPMFEQMAFSILWRNVGVVKRLSSQKHFHHLKNLSMGRWYRCRAIRATIEPDNEPRKDRNPWCHTLPVTTHYKSRGIVLPLQNQIL